jgi:FlaA1/EpsC-like NDP-sugar epimerase
MSASPAGRPAHAGVAFLLQVSLLAWLRIIRRALHEKVLIDALTRLRPAPASPALPRLLIVGSANEAEAFLRAPAALGERYAPVGRADAQRPAKPATSWAGSASWGPSTTSTRS